jgi:hypothetical protein
MSAVLHAHAQAPTSRFTSGTYPANLSASMNKVFDNFGVEGAR